jgi:hypothetical protein
MRWLYLWLVVAAVSVGMTMAVAPPGIGVAAGVVLVVTMVTRRAAVLAVFALIAGMALLRPFALGERYTTIGLAVVVGAALLAAIADLEAGERLPLPRPARSLLVVSLLFAGWLLAVPLLHYTLSPSQYVKAAVSVMMALLAGAVVLRDRRRCEWFMRGVIAVCVLFCASFLVSLLLWTVSGFGTLQIGTFEVFGYGRLPVFFPLTPTSGATMVFRQRVPRLLGPLREPGLFQAFLVWSYFTVGRLQPRRLLRFLLLVGILGTQSTAGFGTFVMMLTVGWILDAERSRWPAGRRLIGVLVVLGALWLAVVAPVFGIQAKQQINEVSITDRSSNTAVGLHAIIDSPLGSDSNSLDTDHNAGINLLASTTLIGVPGLVLGLLVFLRPLWLRRRSVYAVTAVLPLALTALLAQPVMDAPSYYLLVLAAVCLPEAPAAAAEEDVTASEDRGALAVAMRPAG